MYTSIIRTYYTRVVKWVVILFYDVKVQSTNGKSLSRSSKRRKLDVKTLICDLVIGIQRTYNIQYLHFRQQFFN